MGVKVMQIDGTRDPAAARDPVAKVAITNVVEALKLFGVGVLVLICALGAIWQLSLYLSMSVSRLVD
jgi:hypothetical protein